MKKRVILLWIVLGGVSCSMQEPVYLPAPVAVPKAASPEAAGPSARHDSAPEQDGEMTRASYASPSRPLRAYPMKMEGGRDAAEAARSATLDYLQTKPRERDPFYDAVNRTGSNPMNTQDRTTNRPSTLRY